MTAQDDGLKVLMDQIEADEMRYAHRIHDFLETHLDVKDGLLSAIDCLNRRDDSERTSLVDSYGSYVVCLREFICAGEKSSAAPWSFAIMRVLNFYQYGQWVRHASEIKTFTEPLAEELSRL